jgi:hypothetical protein
MLTNLTNLTRSATQTLLTNGTRSLALVVDVNMAQAYALRSRHRSHLQVGRFMPAGMPFVPIEPDPIGIGVEGIIPGSPLGIAWPARGRAQAPSPWSPCSPPTGVRRSERRGDVSGCRVVRPGPDAGQSTASANPVLAAASDRVSGRAHALRKVEAVSKRPRLMGG